MLESKKYLHQFFNSVIYDCGTGYSKGQITMDYIFKAIKVV